MCKKIVSITMALIMIMSMFAGLEISSVAEDDVLSYLTYEINDGEVTITDCDNSISGDVVIPDTIEGYPVTTIGASLFYRCDKIESVVIPSTVKKIGDDIFSGCDAIANITVDKNNEYYSSDDHGVLFNKDKSILICFPENSPLTEYSIPDTVEIIGSSAFAYCKNVSSISIPKSVTTLENKAFWDSDICGDIVLPYNVSKIDWGVFYGCDIESVTITNPNCTIPMGLMYPPIPQKTTIIGYPDSIAEAYAKNFENAFVALEGAPPTEEPTTKEPETEPTTKEPVTQAPTTEKPTEAPTQKPVSDKLEVKDDTIKVDNASKISTVKTKSSADDIIKSVKNKNVSIIDKNGKAISGDTLVGTGAKIQIKDNNGKVISTYTVCVPTDVDGNGKTTAADARLALRGSAKLEKVEGVYASASDMNSDGKITAADARKILRISAGLEKA